MASEPVTTPPGEATARLGGGFGPAGVLVGLAVLALVAIVAFFLVSRSHNAALKTNAVTSAASSLAINPPHAAGAVDPAH